MNREPGAGRDSAPPPGYAAFDVRRVRVVAQHSLAGAVREALSGGTLFEYAAQRAGARALAGRGTAWAAALPNGVEVVVRHVRHGGVLAPVTRDLFLAPSRAPRELAAALRLAETGVPTPEVAAYAVYRAFGPLCRSDVATRRLSAGADFPDAWRGARDDRTREALFDALGVLLEQMRIAGALHPDLNLKNVFVSRLGERLTAFVLDVDRVVFGEAGSLELAGRNFARLVRSARKWHARWGLVIGEEQLARIAAAAGWRPPR